MIVGDRSVRLARGSETDVSDGKTLGRGASWLLTLLVVAVGCSSTPTTGTSEQAPPIQPQSPEVQAEFDDAIALLEEGRWNRAREELRLMQAEHTGDPASDLAELYIARSHLGDLDEQFGVGEPVGGVDGEVFSLLEPLAESVIVDERIRYAAQGYLAVARALNGDIDGALRELVDYPGPSLSPVVLEGDGAWMWALIAEGLSQQQRSEEALAAWGSLYDEIATVADEKPRAELIEATAIASLGDLSGGDAGGDSPEPSARLDLATSRAFSVAEKLDDEAIHRSLSGESPLVRAAAGWAFIHHRLTEADGAIDESMSDTLQEIFNDVSDDFVAIGETDRISELSVALGAVAGPRRLVIGALVPLSGQNRSVGRQALTGMMLAKRAFHTAGEPSVTLVVEDSATGVVDAYRRLVDEGVQAVVGPLGGAEVRQLSDAVREHRVPVMTLAAEAAGSADDSASRATDEERPDRQRAWMYRNFVDSIAEARAAAYIAYERLGDRSAVVVHPDIGYGRMMSQAFADEFRSRGGRILDELEYDRDRSDYVDLAERVAGLQPEAIFLPDTGSKVAELSAFFAQAQIWGNDPHEARPNDNRVWVHYLGTSLWQDPVVTHQAGSYVDGAVVPAWYSPLFEEPETRQFASSYEAVYGRDADQFAVFAYDSVERLRQLLVDRGASEPEQIQQALEREGLESGATGRFHFGGDGRPHRELRYLTVDDSAWSIFDYTVMTPLEGREQFDDAVEPEQFDELDRRSTDGDEVEAVDEP